MKKDLLKIGLVATVASTVALTSPVVNAAEETNTDKQPVENKQETNEVTKSQLNTLEEAKTEAENNVTEKQAEVDKQGKEVDQAKTEVDSVKEEVKKQEELLASSTEENKANVNKEISDTEKTVEDKKAEIVEFNKKEETITEAKQNKEAEVKLAEKELINEEGILKHLATTVKEKETELNNIDNGVSAELKNAQDEKSNVEKEKAQALKDLEDAKALENDSREKIEEAENLLAVKEENLLDITDKILEHNHNKEIVENSINELTKELREEKAKETTSMTSSLTVSDDYKEWIKKVHDANFASEDAKAQDILRRESRKLMEMNPYKSINDNTVVDVNNLDEETRIALNKYMRDLVNSVREQVGTAPLTTTKGSLEFADKISDNYRNKNWDVDAVINANSSAIGHNAEGINSLARERGLATTDKAKESQGRQYYESMFYHYKNKSTMTKDELFALAHESVTGFLFNEEEWGHARHVLGLFNGSKSATTVYFGTDVSVTDKFTYVHFISVPDTPSFVTNRSLFESKFSLEPVGTNSAYDSEKAKMLTNELAKKQRELYNISTQLENLALQKSELEQSMSATVREVNKLKEIKSTVNQKQELVLKAEEKLEKANTRLLKAQEAFTKLGDMAKEKQQELKNAQNEYDSQFAKVEKLKQSLSVKQEEVAKLNNNISNIKKSINKVQDEIKNLTDNLLAKREYLKSLDDAKDKLKEAQNKLMDAEKNLHENELKLKELTDQLNDLKTVKQTKTDEYNKAKSIYDKQQELNKLEKELDKKDNPQDKKEDKKEETTNKDEKPKKDTTTKPQSTKPVTNKKDNMQPERKQDKPQSSDKKETTENGLEVASSVPAVALPQTGEKTNLSMIASVLGILGLSSLVGLRRKEKE